LVEEKDDQRFQKVIPKCTARTKATRSRLETLDRGVKSDGRQREMAAL